MNFGDYYQGRPSSSLLNVGDSVDQQQEDPQQPLTPPMINSSKKRKKLNRYQKNKSLLSSKQQSSVQMANVKSDRKRALRSLQQRAANHLYNSATNLTTPGGSPMNDDEEEEEGDREDHHKGNDDIILNNNGDQVSANASETNIVIDPSAVPQDSTTRQQTTPTTNLQTTNNASSYYKRQHLSQYSSSQAQLQSMTNGSSFVNYINDTSIRKTPKSLLHPRGHKLSFTIASSPTKPMTSMLNVPILFHSTTSTSSRSSQQNRWHHQSATSTLHHQQRSSSISGFSHPVGALGASASTSSTIVPVASSSTLSANQPLPPPYSAVSQTGHHHHHNHHHQMPPPQNVICHQPTANAQQQLASTSELQQLNQTSGCINRFQLSSNAENSNSHVSQQQRNNRTHQVQSSTSQASSNGGQFGAAQQNFAPTPSANSSSNNLTFTSQQQYPLLHNHHHHHHGHHLHNGHVNSQEAVAAAATAAALTNSCLQFNAGTAPKKSCLTCADISIKWYIVVIALLGLICALIGTIVGAVHSAGRDYISLTLLLIGVGLVLVAISWVALRITIKTYKTSGSIPAGRGPPARPFGSAGSGGGPLFLSASPQLARLLAAPSAGNPPGSAQLHPQRLLNERIYMMATAAALSSRPSCVPLPAGSSLEAPAGGSPTSRRLLPRLGSLLRERLPRRLAGLLPGSQPGASGARTNNSSSGDEQAAAAAALAALIGQYQQQLHQHQHSLGGLLFPAAHLSLGAPASSLAELASYRAPPPSYSASMHEQRLRMLMQERASIQQLQQTSALQSGASQPPPPPPPSQASSLHGAQSPAQLPANFGSSQRENGRSQEPQPTSIIIQNPIKPTASRTQQTSRATLEGRGESSGPQRRLSLSSQPLGHSLEGPTPGPGQNGSIGPAKSQLKSSSSSPIINGASGAGETQTRPDSSTIVNISGQRQINRSALEGAAAPVEPEAACRRDPLAQANILAYL